MSFLFGNRGWLFILDHLRGGVVVLTVVVSLAVRQVLDPVVFEPAGLIGGCPRRRSPALSFRPDLRVLDRCARGCSVVLDSRSELSAPGRCARGCFVNGDFLQVSGIRLYPNLPSQYLMSRDLLVLLVHFVGSPLSWAASRLLHLIRN